MTNCRMIAPSLAPSALRIPISRVRSVTDTSMIFIMPMPPTTSEMAAMPARMQTIMFTMEFMLSSISAMEMTV